MMSLHQWTGMLACVLFVLLHGSSADYERRCSLEDRLRSPRGICGRHLSSAVALICNGHYQERAILSSLNEWGKRSADEQIWNDKVFLPKTKAASYLQHKRSVNDASSRVGIVCECCTYQCSIKEMAQYCKQDAATTFSKRMDSQIKRLAPNVMTWTPKVEDSQTKLPAMEPTASEAPVGAQPVKADTNMSNQEVADKAPAEHTGNDNNEAKSLQQEEKQDATMPEDFDRQITELILLKMFPGKKA